MLPIRMSVAFPAMCAGPGNFLQSCVAGCLFSLDLRLLTWPATKQLCEMPKLVWRWRGRRKTPTTRGNSTPSTRRNVQGFAKGSAGAAYRDEGPIRTLNHHDTLRANFSRGRGSCQSFADASGRREALEFGDYGVRGITHYGCGLEPHAPIWDPDSGPRLPRVNCWLIVCRRPVEPRLYGPHLPIPTTMMHGLLWWWPLDMS